MADNSKSKDKNKKNDTDQSSAEKPVASGQNAQTAGTQSGKTGQQGSKPATASASTQSKQTEQSDTTQTADDSSATSDSSSSADNSSANSSNNSSATVTTATPVGNAQSNNGSTKQTMADKLADTMDTSGTKASTTNSSTAQTTSAVTQSSTTTASGFQTQSSADTAANNAVSDGGQTSKTAKVVIDKTLANTATPVVNVAEVALTEGGSVAITDQLFTIKDDDTLNSAIELRINNISNGFLADKNNLTEAIDVTEQRFYISAEDLSSGKYVLVSDGSEQAATFDYQVTDGKQVVQGSVITNYTNVNDPAVFKTETGDTSLEYRFTDKELAANPSGKITVTDVDGSNVIKTLWGSNISTNSRVPTTIKLKNNEGFQTYGELDLVRKGDSVLWDFETTINPYYRFPSDINGSPYGPIALKKGQTMTYKFRLGANDGTQDEMKIIVTGTNEAPSIIRSDGSFYSDDYIREDVGSRQNDGMRVSTLRARIIDDPDTANNWGLAFYDTANSGGKWQHIRHIDYRNNKSWKDFGDRDETNALLLDGNQLVRFVPNANFNGTVSLKVRGWDASDGKRSGNSIDLTKVALGGESAYSEDESFVRVQVTPVDDKTTVSGSTNISIAEGLNSVEGKLTAKDIDHPNVGFRTINGQELSYGVFSIDKSGAWTYQYDTTDSGIQAMGAGEKLTLDQIKVTTTGSGNTVNRTLKFTVTGVDDDSEFSGDTTGTVTEADIGDVSRITGTMTISDVDTKDSPTILPSSAQGNYGSFAINADGNWSYTLDQTDIQALNVNDQLQEVFTVTASDGNTETVVITVQGSDDVGSVSGNQIAYVYEDVLTRSSATSLTITDIDNDDAAFNNESYVLGDYGYVSLQNNTWTYTVLNTSPYVQALPENASIRDTITLTANDGKTTYDVTGVIFGTNDEASISGDRAVFLSEDSTVAGTGWATVTDVDANEARFSQSSYSGTYGDVTILGRKNGRWRWSYKLSDEGRENLQSLAQGQSATDSVRMLSKDGTASHTIDVTIFGVDDAPVIDGVTTGNLVEDSSWAIVGGQLSISDVDSPVTVGFQQGNLSANYGSAVFLGTGWYYLLDASNVTVQGLAAGEILTDVFTVTATDGVTQQDIRVAITGVNDAASISYDDESDIAATLTEANVGDTVTATGTILLTEVDVSEQGFRQTAISGDYGDLTLTDNENGTWTWVYTLDQHAVQTLNAGDRVDETISLTSIEGASQDIRLTIVGTDDAPVISGQTRGAVTEDGLQVVTGNLSVTDVDTDNVSINDVSMSGDYGSLTVVNHTWTYTLNNHVDAVQSLPEGSTLTDQFTLTTANGAASTQLVMTIAGADDAAVISGVTTAEFDEPDTAMVQTGSLSISDIDSGAAPSFVVDAIASDYANFSISSDGSWTYRIDADAVQFLADGEQVQDSFTVTATDGSTQMMRFNINGVDDVPVITGSVSGSVTEDAHDQQQLSGSLAISDVDNANVTFNNAYLVSDYGTLAFANGRWDYVLDNSSAPVQSLATGESLQDQFVLTANDGETTQTITLTIQGADDAVVIRGVVSGDVIEDTLVSATGSLQLEHVDMADSNVAFIQTTYSGAYGDLDINRFGHWTYTLANSDSAVQSLSDGETLTDVIRVYTSSEPTESQDITVTITGSNDAPTIVVDNSGAVVEDTTMTATGDLRVLDVDALDYAFEDVTITGDYGRLIYADNVWTYTLSNDHVAVQALTDTETLTDVFTLTANDGTTTQTISMTITGTDDAPVITGDVSGDVTEDTSLIAQGSLSITDVDNEVIAFDDITVTGSYGELVLTDQSWVYTLSETNTTVQALAAGETITETITLTANDGETDQVITVTITGTDDAPVITGDISGGVTEDSSLIAQGSLSITDVDNEAIAFDDITVTGSYGELVLTDQSWVYTLSETNTSVQALAAGDTITDIIMLTANDDETAQTITLTITGTDDTPVITGDVSGGVTEDSSLTAQGSLSITDVDNEAIAFDDITVTGSYGELVLTDQSWVYTLSEANTTVQALAAGDTITDIIMLTANDDETAQTITLTITGTDDTPVITGDVSGGVTEDSSLTAQGSLSITDVDNDAIAFADTTLSGSYGSLNVEDQDWTYSLSNTHASVQALGAGETLTETFTLTANDGETTQALTITITGTDDAPVITGDVSGGVTEDSSLIAQGSLSISDVDNEAIAFDDITVTGNYGELVLIDQSWVYTLSETNTTVQALAAGDTITDTITLTANDEATSQTITLTITGTDDAAVITGNVTGDVVEDTTTVIYGELVVSDVDNSDFAFAESSVAGSYGTLAIEIENNVWTYTLNNSHADVQSLAAGDTLTDAVTLTANDGTTTQTVTITITGTDDAPVVSGDVSGGVTEDTSLIAQGSLSITDVDNDAIAFADTTLSGSYGSLSVEDQDWTYTLSNAYASVQALGADETLTETFTLTANDDDTTQVITITVNGTDDLPVVTGDTAGAVTEDVSITVEGDIAVTDADNVQIAFADINLMGDYGEFSLADSTWSYTLDQGSTEVQALAAGDTLEETFTLTANDGVTTQAIVVTITGTDDAPEISGDVSGNVTEDTSLTVEGEISISDIDNHAIAFSDTNIDGSYGSLALVNHVWTYTLNNSLNAVQSLAAGESLTDTITLTANDGQATQAITITILGQNDAPVLTNNGISVNMDSDVEISNDHIALTDVDSADNALFYTVTELPTRGVLFDIYSEQEVEINSTITEAALDAGSLLYIPDAGYYGSDAFMFSYGDAFPAVAGQHQEMLITVNAIGTSGADGFEAAYGAVSYQGLGGNDDIIGSSGEDTLNGGAGNDTIDGAGGADTIIAGSGDDTVVLDLQDTSIDFGDGVDTLNVGLSQQSGNMFFGAFSINGLVTNVEEIVMEVGDAPIKLFTATPEEVVALTDDNNTLTVSADSVPVSLENVENWAEVAIEPGYITYTSELDGVEVTLRMEDNLGT